jgi:hypothetical protein
VASWERDWPKGRKAHRVRWVIQFKLIHVLELVTSIGTGECVKSSNGGPVHIVCRLGRSKAFIIYTCPSSDDITSPTGHLLLPIGLPTGFLRKDPNPELWLESQEPLHGNRRTGGSLGRTGESTSCESRRGTGAQSSMQGSRTCLRGQPVNKTTKNEG